MCPSATSVVSANLPGDQRTVTNDFSPEDLAIMMLLSKYQKQILEVIGDDEVDVTV